MTQVNIFVYALKMYREFFPYDIEFSQICGKHYYAIDNVRKILALSCINNHSKLDLGEINGYIDDIKTKCIKEYEKDYFKDIQGDDINMGNKDVFDKIKSSLGVYIATYETVYNYEPKLHEGMLIELNNALSHIVALSINKEEDNIKDAKGHLYRGALDGLKAIIIEKIELIKNDKKLLNKLMEMRVKEAAHIGKIVSSGIVRDYIDFVKKIDNMKENQ